MSDPLDTCKIYTLQNIRMIHISEFARITNRSVRSTRHLVEDGNKIRKMKFFRDRSRLMIPVTELLGYPLTTQGHVRGEREVYHYRLDEDTGTYIKTLCPECSYGEPCPERQIADALEVPEGDK